MAAAVVSRLVRREEGRVRMDRRAHVRLGPLQAREQARGHRLSPLSREEGRDKANGAEGLHLAGGGNDVGPVGKFFVGGRDFHCCLWCCCVYLSSLGCFLFTSSQSCNRADSWHARRSIGARGSLVDRGCSRGGRPGDVVADRLRETFDRTGIATLKCARYALERLDGYAAAIGLSREDYALRACMRSAADATAGEGELDGDRSRLTRALRASDSMLACEPDACAGVDERSAAASRWSARWVLRVAV